MGSGAIKWHVHCSVCGAFIEKSAQKRFRSGVQKNVAVHWRYL